MIVNAPYWYQDTYSSRFCFMTPRYLITDLPIKVCVFGAYWNIFWLYPFARLSLHT